MNSDQIDKYQKLGWEFTDNGEYFKSPRMYESWWIDSIYKVEEKKLLEREVEAILCNIRLDLNHQFDKIVDDIVQQQKILIEKGMQPEKMINVSFKVNFK